MNQKTGNWNWIIVWNNWSFYMFFFFGNICSISDEDTFELQCCLFCFVELYLFSPHKVILKLPRVYVCSVCVRNTAFQLNSSRAQIRNVTSKNLSWRYSQRSHTAVIPFSLGCILTKQKNRLFLLGSNELG